MHSITIVIMNIRSLRVYSNIRLTFEYTEYSNIRPTPNLNLTSCNSQLSQYLENNWYEWHESQSNIIIKIKVQQSRGLYHWQINLSTFVESLVLWRLCGTHSLFNPKSSKVHELKVIPCFVAVVQRISKYAKLRSRVLCSKYIGCFSEGANHIQWHIPWPDNYEHICQFANVKISAEQ